MSLDNQKTTQDFTSKTLTWFGAYFISFVGLLHLLLSGEHFGYAVYLGLLFLANFAVSAVAALGILWTGRRWAWLLGAVVASTAFIGFLVSRVFGLPKFPEAAGQWFNFGGWMAVGFELAFLAAVPLVLTRSGRKLVKKEQHRIDAERLPRPGKRHPNTWISWKKRCATYETAWLQISGISDPTWRRAHSENAPNRVSERERAVFYGSYEKEDDTDGFENEPSARRKKPEALTC